MNTIVFDMGRRSLEYTWFNGSKTDPILVGSVDRVKIHSARASLSLMAGHLQSASGASAAEQLQPQVIAFRVPFGGTEFRQPVVVDADVLRRLDDLGVYAPLHLPGIVALMRGCQQCYPAATIVAVFETAFFAELPAKEHLYAVDASVTRSLQLRRFGYHGLLHEAACAEHKEPRLLSVCLEPRPEVTALLNGRPVLVTGGATPLEGLPGEKACGDIDPGIILTLSQREDLGLERINLMLTQESGLLGLTGEAVNLPTIFADESPRYRLAREFFRYRVLLACGAGKAALGGVDRIVFSGCYHAVGASLGPWLATRLANRDAQHGKPPEWSCFTRPLPQIIAETARKMAAK